MKYLKIVCGILAAVFLMMVLSNKDPFSLTCLIFDICIFAFVFYNEKSKECDKYRDKANNLEKEKQKLQNELFKTKNNIISDKNKEEVKATFELNDEPDENYITDREYEIIESRSKGETHDNQLSKQEIVCLIKRIGSLYQKHFASDYHFPPLSDKKILSYLTQIYFPYELKTYQDDEILELLEFHFKDFKESDVKYKSKIK